MHTLEWLNRQSAFTTSARVPHRLLKQLSVHASNLVRPEPFLAVRPELVEGSPASTRPVLSASKGSARTDNNNLLIQGDNLEALKALPTFYCGQVKCIFIDPPYNTKSAFEHYDDNLEHAQWLSMMLPRLQLLRELLREDGSIWVTIDDNEGHYLKMLMDEVFGRGNIVATCIWQSRYSRSSDTSISISHNFVHCYAVNPSNWKNVRNRLQQSELQGKQFNNPDGDPLGAWRAIPWDAPNIRANLSYPITTPSGKVRLPPPGRCWSRTEQEWNELVASGLAYFGRNGAGAPSFKQYLPNSPPIVPNTWWGHEEAGHTDEAKKEIVTLFGSDNVFDTPKPGRLLQRILHIATNENDLILDSFLGSGTTAAVAHKMRRWIGIEMGKHAATHCLPRLQKVMDGEQGGISKAVGWHGGGSFRFMRLGEAVFDEAGRINPAVRFSSLAAFVWQQRTGASFDAQAAKPGTAYLGTHYQINSCLRTDHVGYIQFEPIKPPKFPCYLLYNGILGDKRPASGNVLTRDVLTALLTLHATTPGPQAPLLVYGEARRLGAERLKQANVTFKHIPYEVRGR